MRNVLRFIPILLVLACFTIAATAANSHRVPRKKARAVPGVLEKAAARYASLKSYSDSGTITTEYGPTGTSDPPAAEHYTFTTFYRAPRQFLFDFKKGPNADDERLVIWADGADFNTWWSATKVHETYPKGEGANAFALSAFPTKDSAMKIAPLLFAGAGLHGSLTDFKLTRSDPDETLNGHRCYKLVGEVALAYGTGAVTDSRATTVWIDAETLLVRKVLEDSSDGTAIDRITTTFEPEADAKIDDVRFKFVSPAGN